MFCKSSAGDRAKFSPCALGMALGVVKGLYLLLAAWISWLWGYGAPMVAHLGEYYHGYSSSLMGGLAGGAYGLVCGFVFGFVIAYFYNCFVGCGKCSSVKEESK
jgi:hypothetical protein